MNKTKITSIEQRNYGSVPHLSDVRVCFIVNWYLHTKKAHMPSVHSIFQLLTNCTRPISHYTFCTLQSVSHPHAIRPQWIRNKWLWMPKHFNDVPFSIGLISHYSQTLTKFHIFSFDYSCLTCARCYRSFIQKWKKKTRNIIRDNSSKA